MDLSFIKLLFQITCSQELTEIFFPSDVILERLNIIELLLKVFLLEIGFHNMNYKDFIFSTFFSRLFIYEKCVPI